MRSSLSSRSLEDWLLEVVSADSSFWELDAEYQEDRTAYRVGYAQEVTRILRAVSDEQLNESALEQLQRIYSLILSDTRLSVVRDSMTAEYAYVMYRHQRIMKPGNVTNNPFFYTCLSTHMDLLDRTRDTNPDPEIVSQTKSVIAGYMNHWYHRVRENTGRRPDSGSLYLLLNAINWWAALVGDEPCKELAKVYLQVAVVVYDKELSCEFYQKSVQLYRRETVWTTTSHAEYLYALTQLLATVSNPDPELEKELSRVMSFKPYVFDVKEGQKKLRD